MVISTIGIYPYSTILEDYHGNIHLFEGMQDLTVNGCRILANGKEADVFFQLESDCEAIREYLDEEDRMLLSMGYVIATKAIPDDYFITY